MKGVLKIALSVFAITFAMQVKAQDAHALIVEGVKLNNSHNYAGAIEKYKAAINLEPNNASANYQLAFSLNASRKSKEALPYLQKVVKSGSSPAVIGSSYELMGTIYDQSAQPQKAIESYELGIKADSSSQSLRYNLGLAYFRTHQYAAAEQSAIAAIQIDPKYASSWRLYALVTFHQNKRAAALLGFCSFLWFEPTGARAQEAYGNLQHILQGGNLKPQPSPPNYSYIEQETYKLNQTIRQAMFAVSKRRYVTKADLFTEQLRALFTAIGPIAKERAINSFFKEQAGFYYNLAQSPHLEAFSHFIRQSADKTAAAWLQNHQQEVTELDNWVKLQHK